ncbi:MAG: CBS domain-containing protein [Bradyrhizobium sp.]|nr:CBS domain-containing protein [Pseudomonadota bacterium]MDE2472452.1 CBS domain-containing protein [Bradyrhizobium sp.]
MNAADIMTQPVITVTPDARMNGIATILVEKNIGAVPVVDANGALVGIVTEGDLLRRKELGTERHRRPIAAFMASNLTLEEDYIRSHAMKASDFMRGNIITAAPSTSLSDIVDLLEKHRIKRIPIVENGKLVGIVSRADLVRALAAVEPSTPEHASDATIRRDLVAELARYRWGRAHGNRITVRNGIVHLWGVVEASTEIDAIRVAAEAIPGVLGVQDHTAVAPIVGMDL